MKIEISEHKIFNLYYKDGLESCWVKLSTNFNLYALWFHNFIYTMEELDTSWSIYLFTNNNPFTNVQKKITNVQSQKRGSALSNANAIHVRSWLSTNAIHMGKWLRSCFRCRFSYFRSSKYIPKPQCLISCSRSYTASIWALRYKYIETRIRTPEWSLVLIETKMAGEEQFLPGPWKVLWMYAQ